MTWLALTGPILGVTGCLVGILNYVLQRRGQGHTEKADDERLGHEELVAALDFYRERTRDAEARAERAEAREQACKEEKREVQDKMTDLLYILERRREQ